MNIASLLYEQKENSSSFVVCGDRKITYKELHKDCMRFSKVLKKEFSQVIAIYAENSIDFVFAYFSILYAGKVAIALNEMSTVSEIENILSKCNSKTILTNTGHAEKIAELEGYHIITVDNMDLSNIEYDDGDEVTEPESKYVMFLPTSGTTSESKIVMYEHERVWNALQRGSNYLKKTDKSVELLIMPLTASFIMFDQLLASVKAGASMVICGGILLMNKIYRLIGKYQVTSFNTVPSYLGAVIDEYKPEKHNISSLQTVWIGGEKASSELYEKVKKYFTNVKVMQSYGLTECPMLVSRREDDWSKKPEAVGRLALPINVKIVGENEVDLGVNNPGEITVKSNSSMSGYYGKENIVENDSWIHTGDYGMIDEEGFLYIFGRIKNIIISGGKNIFPEEVEQIMKGSEMISEVRVRGEANSEVGEIVVADVVLKEEDFDPKELVSYLSDKMASYKIPVKFYVVDEIAKTASKKIKRY